MSVSISRGWAVLSLIVVMVCGGCETRDGEAIVREKEHIPVAEAVPSPSAILSSNRAQDATAPNNEPTPGEEIVTEEKEDSGTDVRGTSKDPRASDHEHWIVNVEMVHDLRRIEVRVDQPQWAALKVGDRVKVTYKIGKYTGTIWGASIQGP
jgi:hypothetical protein